MLVSRELCDLKASIKMRGFDFETEELHFVAAFAYRLAEELSYILP
ncbi:hypothetical protein IE077_004020 [Cardiosporidium cionae]|uniref:Uncharacterized protein n=1 Tax=Cardiosporidium cionae TaxID=476202 RepID=A0ABQ7J712_9APIC|nr:hypothetical protein IE077_004020 [Cardiosporidium cionae]|eukprot:KAF8819773.1 hypothetical protein IE077_004020 [Cardiosporidium cionae]